MQCHTFTCGQDSFLVSFSFSPVFQESAVKATNQGQAKFRDLHTYVTSTIQISLSPSRITGLSHQSRQLLCGQRESNPGFQLVELQCYHRALAHNLVIVVAKLLLSIFVNPKNGKIEYRQELWKATLYLNILYCMYLYIIHYT